MYSNSPSHVKYAGGCTLGPLGAVSGAGVTFEDRLVGELVGVAGYGNGVEAFGG